MLPKPLRILWGDLSADEIKRFGILSSTLLLIIGAYWQLRTLKDALFDDLVGLAFQPKAKIVSLVVIVPLVLGYSKLVDLVEKHKLFYIICTAYSLMFLSVA